MPYKDHRPPLPFLDPALDPNHPFNQIYDLGENPRLPLTRTERKRLERSALEEALAGYAPPHVIRTYEVVPNIADQRLEILSLTLPHRPADLAYRDENPYHRSMNQPPFNPSDDRTDFRRFAERRLHLGYWRIHASHGNPGLPSEEISLQQYGPDDPHHTDFPPEEICWILEYTKNECAIIRRKLAWAMGLYPACIDPETSLYSDEMKYRYNRRLLTACRRKNKYCIRPIHLQVTTFNGIVLP